MVCICVSTMYFCIFFSMTLFLKCPRYSTKFLRRWQGWRNYMVMTGQSKKKALILESNIQYKCKSVTRNYWDGWETISLSFKETLVWLTSVGHILTSLEATCMPRYSVLTVFLSFKQNVIQSPSCPQSCL